MNTSHPSDLARRLLGRVKRERASDALRASILAAGHAEIARKGVDDRAAEVVSELASARRPRARARGWWVDVAAFAAAATLLFAALKMLRAPEPGVLISAESSSAGSSSGARSGSTTPGDEGAERAGRTTRDAPNAEVEAQPAAPAVDPAARRAPRPPSEPRDDASPRSEPKLPSPPAPRSLPAPERADNPPPAQTPPSLGAQLEQIKRIRAALRAGDHRRALELVDAYRSSPAGGELAAEASLLRIEALSLSGQRDAAAREARQFASDYPNSPLIDRALGFAGSDAPER